MKILEINSVCGIRSTGRICTDIAEVLEVKGHTCKIAYGREAVPEKYKKIAMRIGNKLSVSADAVITRVLDNAGFNSYFSTKKIIRQIKEYNPDIIHLHNIHGYYINIKILFDYLKNSGKPVVWTLHDCWSFTGHCVHFTTLNCEKWKSQCFSCPKKKAYPSSVLFDNSKRNYKRKKAIFTSLTDMTIITPSEWLASKVRESFLGKYAVYCIPNGIDLEVFKPTESDFRKRHGLEDKKIILGAATAWSKQKGINVFAELSQRLDDSYKVVLVGIKPETAKTLPKKILALPRTNSIKEMAEIYTSADVFLNLGKEETMGLTTVEAMACGTPVVTSNLTAVPEVVRKEGGIVSNSLKPESIMECIEKVLSVKYDETRKNAQEYEKNLQYTKYLEVYENVMKKYDGIFY